ncbi:MAG: CAP domain-containing protein [Anaerolineae bacterium]
MPARPVNAGRSLVAAIAIVVALAASLAAPAHARPTARPSADDAADAAAAAEAMLTKLNAARAANGLRPYRSSPLLARVAAGHAREVAEHNHFSHTGLDGRSAKQRMADAGYGAGHTGVRTSENFVARATVDEGFDWLMSDKDHRPNMLDPKFREVGVGTGKTRYGFVWVLDFGTYDGVDAAVATEVTASNATTAASNATTAASNATTAAANASTFVTTTTSLTTTTSVTTTSSTSSTTGVTRTLASTITAEARSPLTTTASTSPPATAGATPIATTGGVDGAVASPTPAGAPRAMPSASIVLGVVVLFGVLAGLALVSMRPRGGRRR